MKQPRQTIVIGDIHGCLQEFEELLEKLEYDQLYDRLILLGDLVDRGPQSIGVVRAARKHGAECIQGNHDNKYVRYWRHDQKSKQDPKYKNPMKFPKEKIEIYQQLSEEDLKYLESCPFKKYIEEYNLLAVHAGVIPSCNPFKQKNRTYAHARFVDKDTYKMLSIDKDNGFAQPSNSIHWSEAYEGSVDIVYGHDVKSLEEVQVRYNNKGARTIALDTGCCFGGKLSAMSFSSNTPKGEIIQVQSSDVKCPDYVLTKRS